MPLSSGRVGASPSLNKTFLPHQMHVFCFHSSTSEYKNHDLLETLFAVKKVVERLPSKCEALSSNLSTAIKIKILTLYCNIIQS
jgi:hypothetical protein